MKDIYKQFNNIEVDLEKINSTNIELDDVTKKRIKNNLHLSIKPKKHRILLEIGVPTAVAILLAISSFAIPRESLIAFADNIPVLNTLFKRFNTHYGGNFEDYTQIIGKTVNDNEFEITIDEVAVDDFAFKLIYTVRSDEKISEVRKKSGQFPHTGEKTLKINGKAINASLGGSEKEIDDYTIQVIESLNVDLIKIPNNFTVEIDFNELADVKGNWNFKFDASKEKTTRATQKYKINKELKANFTDPENEQKYGEIYFKEIIFSPISTVINIKTNDADFVFSSITFKDDKGNIIGQGTGSLLNNKGRYIFNPVKEIPNKIIVEHTDSATSKVTTLEIPIK